MMRLKMNTPILRIDRLKLLSGILSIPSTISTYCNHRSCFYTVVTWIFVISEYIIKI